MIEIDQIRDLRYAPSQQDGGLPIEVLDREALMARYPASWFAQPERLAFHLVLLNGSRVGVHEVDFQRHRLAPRSALVLRPGQVQRFDPARRFEARLVLISEAAAAVTRAGSAFPRGSSAQPLRVDACEAAALDQLAGQLAAEADRSRGAGVATALLDALLARLERLTTEQLSRASDDPRLTAFLALLDAHHGEHRDVAWYAGRLGYTPQTLTRLTRRASGASAKNWIDGRVALEAQRLLAATDRPVEDIAHQLGFSQATNFSRHFVHQTGISPARFRAEQRAWPRGL